MTPREQFVSFKTIVIKEYLRFIRIWVQTVLPAGMTMALYFIIFGRLIGSQIGSIDGLSYMDYIVPGVILMAIINNAYSNVVSSFFSAKFQRHIEEMLVSPMPSYLIVMGFVAGGVIRGMIVGVVVLCVSLFFTNLHVLHPLATVVVIVLTAILFSLGGLINAIFARTFDDISIVPTFVLTPLTYLGGVFYSIDMLPQFWQSVSLLNPILYMVNALRYGMVGVHDIDLGVAFTIIVLFVAVLFSAAVWLLNRGINMRT